MSAINYKEGDVVKLRDDLIKNGKYPLGEKIFQPAMEKYKGQKLTIKECFSHGYFVKEDEQNPAGYWYYNDEMLEPWIDQNQE